MTAAKLQKIILGRLHPNIRAMAPASWLPRGIPAFKESVKPTPPATMEIAKTMKPPMPPVETAKGYNPAMDQPRPNVLKDYLRQVLPECNLSFADSLKGTMMSYSSSMTPDQ